LFTQSIQKIKQNLFFMSFFSDNDYIRYCISLANRAKGHTKTNPMVGSCLVYNHEIIGNGWHKGFGLPHAEVMTIESVKPKKRHLIEKSTLYVTLEPCNHYGKTPPCTDLILRHKIPKVVVGCMDPHPLVAGSGLQKLKDHGIEVIEGVEAEACRELIHPFVISAMRKRPYIILKWAQSEDGYIGKEDEQVWLSNKLSKKLVHSWRAEVDAIHVGYLTVITDNPELTTREVEGRSPIRVIFDKDQSLPPDSKIFNDQAHTWVFTHAAQKKESPNNTRYFHMEERDSGDLELISILTLLYKNQIGSILIEGGSKTIQRFYDAGLWDEIRCIQTKARLGDGIRAPIIDWRNPIKTINLQDNKVVFFRRADI